MANKFYTIITFIISMSFLVLVSCSEEEKPEGYELKSDEIITIYIPTLDTRTPREKLMTVHNEELIPADIIAEKIPTYIRYQKKYNRSFSLSNFRRLISENLVLQKSFNYSFPPAFFENYSSYLCYYSDSSRFLDIYSSNLKLSKDIDGNRIVEEIGKSMAKLHILKDKSMDIIVFSGSTPSLDEACWLNENLFLIFGNIFEYVGESYKPICWRIDLENNIIDTYIYQGELQDPEYTYWESKFKNAYFFYENQ